MAPHVFWAAALPHLYIYPILLLISIALHWILFRKYILSVIDPLFLIVFGFTFALCTLFFVFIVADVSFDKLVIILAMHIVSYIGFFIFAPNVTRILHYFSSNHFIDSSATLNFRYTLLTVGYFCFIAATLISYSMIGIPLFKASRLGGYEGSGGLGIIARIQDIATLISAILSARLLLLPKSSNNAHFHVIRFFCIFSLILLLILSASKSAVLLFFQITYMLYICIYYYANNSLPRLFTLRWVLICLFVFLSSLVALYISPSTEGSILVDNVNSRILNSFFALIYRFINFGDISIYYFINNAYASLPDDNGLISLFAGILGPLRIVSYSDIPLHMGYQLSLQAIPGMDIIAGPNANASIFGYHYFGVILGFIFSFIMGCIMGLARRVLVSAITNLVFIVSRAKFILGVAQFIFGFSTIGILIDPPLIISYLSSLVITFTIITVLALIIWSAQPNKPVFNRALIADK